MTFDPIQAFLRALESELTFATKTLRDDILQEVEAHLADVAERDGDEAALSALEGFGTAKSYAAVSLEARGLQHALAEPASGRLWAATLTSAGRSIIVMTSALTGFTFAILSLAFVAIALTELIAPQLTGLFIGDGRLAFGIMPASLSDGLEDILGWWILPLSVVGAVLSAMASLGVLRLGLRRRLKALPIPR